LWLWTVNPTLPHACWLQQQWGFTHMNVVSWVKPSGWGYWWANCTEHLLFAYKGKVKMNKRLMLTAFHEGRREHSRKPDRAYEYIEQISEGPYLEMFARHPRQGWDHWGNEIEGGIDIWQAARTMTTQAS
jgi:N6-adenosine-specific RNA methylase IME4